MHHYHALKVQAKHREARDALRIALDVPPELRASFSGLPGQHLPVRIDVDGKVLRRTYSVCSAPGQWPLEIGVRVQPGGAFSGYAAQRLAPGDVIEAMPPTGRFHATIDATANRHYLAFAAGSGITPILAIVRAVLDGEPDSRVTLFYGNRDQQSTMFIDELFALKNRYPARLQLQFLFSREAQEFPIAEGRLDGPKVQALWSSFVGDDMPDQAFVCGPDSMIDTVRDTLVGHGMPAERVHAERFGVPRRTAVAGTDPAPRAAGTADVTVILDGHRRTFTMGPDDANLVDAAAAQGLELPYSCKGGVCATCRCRLVEGEVRMAVNYGLEPWEVEKGYILACQSVPLGPAVTLDYDTP